MNTVRIPACLLASCLIAQGAARAEEAAKEITNSIGMKLVWIPPGSFTMGSPNGEPERKGDENPHKVTLTKGYYMGAYPVTQDQWQAIMGKNPARFKGKNLPIENVSWIDSQEFLEKLSKKEEKKYRLPTEAEWEYACRAGTTTAFSFGNSLAMSQANYDFSTPYPGGKASTPLKKTTPVDHYPPNKWGLYDMHGNVYNWCADWYGPYPSGDVTDPKGPASGTERVMRGGSFVSRGSNLRSACRNPYEPIYRIYNVGFRFVQE